MAWPGDNEIQVYRESCSTWTSQSGRTQHHCHSSHRGQEARRTWWEPSLDLTLDFGCNSLSVVLWLLRKSPSPAIIFQTFDGRANRCELRQSHYDCQVFTFSRLYRNKGTINIIGDEKKINKTLPFPVSNLKLFWSLRLDGVGVYDYDREKKFICFVTGMNLGSTPVRSEQVERIFRDKGRCQVIERCGYFREKVVVTGSPGPDLLLTTCNLTHLLEPPRYLAQSTEYI